MRTRKRFWRKRPDDIERRLAAMIEKGFTQADMAAALGVTRQTISNWLQSCGFEPVLTYAKRQAA